ncbi:MAG: FAD-dependent oxidoreductase [Candidatus Roizmanbacteria bacterium]|nr:FAD-dependent oxidoreductase [Candidatus Roizmanbacteria bacterium]
MKQTKAFLSSKKLVAPDVAHMFFYVEGEGFEFNPGQYVILTVPNSPTPLKRLYSLAGTNSNKNVFELLIKFVPGGVASEYIRSLKIGDNIDISGPAGLFSEQKTPSNKVYMVTGTGFAPIRSILASKDHLTTNRSLFWGLKNLSETYMFEELFSLKHSNPSFTFSYCLSQQDSFSSIPADLLQYYRSGHIDTVWDSVKPIVKPEDEYYLCGSRTVIESLRLLLLSRGVSKDRLFFEKY